jgi:hypothetical protein
MRKILMTVIIVAAVIGVGIGIGWLAGRGTVTPPPPVAQAPSDATPGNHAPSAPDDNHSTPVVSAPPHTGPIVTSQPAPPIQTDAVTQVAATNLAASTNWEDNIDSIVGSDDDDTNKVKQLFALFPKLPPDGQEEAVQHLSNLVDDTNYAQLGALMKNDSLSEGVLDELLADLLNRPNNLKLPMLLDVAQDPNNAKSAEAKDLLELYLGEDYGDNWTAWQTNMNNWMQQNPD